MKATDEMIEAALLALHAGSVRDAVEAALAAAPPCEYIRSTGEGTHYCALAAAPQGEPAYSYACRLAESMYRRHYLEDISPVWTPLPDLLGVLTQIDNMVSGLVRREAARTALFELTEISAGTVDALPGRDQTRLLDAIDALREALGDAK